MKHTHTHNRGGGDQLRFIIKKAILCERALLKWLVFWPVSCPYVPSHLSQNQIYQILTCSFWAPHFHFRPFFPCLVTYKFPVPLSPHSLSSSSDNPADWKTLSGSSLKFCIKYASYHRARNRSCNIFMNTSLVMAYNV